MLLDFSAKYPDAEKPLASWWAVCKKNNFASFNDLKKIFGTADIASFNDLKKIFGTADIVSKCVIFNMGGGKYRLIVRVNFSANRMWIKYILPHAKY